jgi:ATP-dependent Clp protease ATP-binding subunit ClpX
VLAPTGGRKHPHQEYIRMDTTNILFIAGGAFSGLLDVIRSRTEQRTMGFGADVKSRKEWDAGEILSRVEHQDLLKFGMIPEFIGRFPIVTTLENLGEKELMQILTEPKNALVKQYAKLFEIDGVELRVDEPALQAIARQAVDMETGARGLRAIMEKLMMDLMFDLPSMSSEISQVRITESVVNGLEEPILLKREKKSA